MLLLFIIEAEKFSVTHKKPFFLRLKKNKHRSMEEMIVSFFVKPVQTIQGKQHEIVK